MFSLKDTIRRKITLTLAASVAIAVLVGCSNTSEPVESDSAAATTTENAEVHNTDVAESQATSLADPALNGADTSKPLTTPENQQAMEDYNDALEQYRQDVEDKITQEREENGKPQPDRNLAPEKSNDGNASKPDVKTTPDGKYTIAPTDLQNSDGTFTQQLGTGDPSDVVVPAVCTAAFAEWTPEFAARQKGQSNPSKIPYSAITLENAAEAFPYLGYIGYSPDYIEILPTDTQYQIETKIFNNLCGTSAKKYYGNYADPNEMPSHCFSSEAEYNAWVQKRKEERAEADRQDEKARQENEAGNYGFHNEDYTPEELEDLAEYFKSLGY